MTEVLGGGKFYVQTVSDGRIASIQQQLEALRVQDKPFAGFPPKKGDLVIAQFSGDETWNRALVGLRFVFCAVDQSDEFQSKLVCYVDSLSLFR